MYQTVMGNKFIWTDDTAIIWRNIRYAAFNNDTNVTRVGGGSTLNYTVACKGSQTESLPNPNFSWIKK